MREQFPYDLRLIGLLRCIPRVRKLDAWQAEISESLHALHTSSHRMTHLEKYDLDERRQTQLRGTRVKRDRMGLTPKEYMSALFPYVLLSKTSGAM